MSIRRQIVFLVTLVFVLTACRQDEQKPDGEDKKQVKKTEQQTEGAKPLVFPPLPSGPKKYSRDTTEVSAGKEIEYPEKFDKTGGVTVATDVTFTSKPHDSKNVDPKDPKERTTENAIEFTSRAADCRPAAWLQFVWRERYYNDDKTPTGGKYKIRRKDKEGSSSLPTELPLTEHPDDPKVEVDSPSSDSPYYNAEAAHKDDHSMIDAPRASDLEDTSRIKDAEKQVMHFSTYLLCDGKIRFHMLWHCIAERKEGENFFGPCGYVIDSGEKDGKLDDREQKALLDRYSAQFPNH